MLDPDVHRTPPDDAVRLPLVRVQPPRVGVGGAGGASGASRGRAYIEEDVDSDEVDEDTDAENTALAERKLRLTNAVAASLISSPDFYGADDPTKMSLLSLLLPIIESDPEFILKLAL